MTNWRFKSFIILVPIIALLHFVITFKEVTTFNLLIHGTIFVLTTFLSYLAFRNGTMYAEAALETKKINLTLEEKIKDATLELSQKIEELESSTKNLNEAKAKDEAFLASIGEGVFATDDQRKVQFLNKTGEKMLGWKAQELIGAVINTLPLVDEQGDLIPLEKRPTVIAMKSGKTIVYNDAFFVRPDKTKFPIAITASPIKIGEKTTGTIILFRDTTKEKQSEEEIRKFYEAVEAAAEHIMITDSDAVILYANKAAEKITGYSQAEMIGQHPSLWGNHMDKEFYKKMWKTIKEDKTTFRGELKNKRKNGQEYFADLYITPILDSDGHVKFFVGIERDITPEKELEKTQMDFFSLASHQLRTPLSGIKWQIETMQKEKVVGKLTRKQKEYLNSIYKTNEVMIKLVFDVLSVLRLQSLTGETAIKKEIISVPSLFDDLLVSFKAAADKKKIKLRNTIKKKSPLVVETDSELLKTILQSLFSNAVDYSDAGQEVIFGVTEEPTAFVFSVRDHGIGIPKEEQNRISERFYRASNAKLYKPGGTGLGLYIAFTLAGKIGGKISFESTTGKGSTFYLRIPKKANSVLNGKDASLRKNP